MTREIKNPGRGYSGKEKFESLPQQKTKLNRYRNEKGQFK